MQGSSRCKALSLNRLLTYLMKLRSPKGNLWGMEIPGSGAMLLEQS